MRCSNCNSPDALIVRTQFDANLNKVETCDKCGTVRLRDASTPDVYIGSKGGLMTDMNLHDPKTKQPIPFSTKGEKAAIMKRLNLKQADSAERQHGARDVAKNAKYHEV